jgi:hypothetical protein
MSPGFFDIHRHEYRMPLAFGCRTTAERNRYPILSALTIIHVSMLVAAGLDWEIAGDIAVDNWSALLDWPALAEADGDKELPVDRQFFLGVTELPNGFHSVCGPMTHILAKLPTGLADIRTVNLHLAWRMLRRNAELAEPPIELPPRLMLSVTEPGYQAWRDWIEEYREIALQRERAQRRKKIGRLMATGG